MIRLSRLFEEDIEIQDAIEDMVELDDTEDIIIGAIEDRNSEKGDLHDLFSNPEDGINDDGLTEEEEHQANVMLLTDDNLTDDDITDDIKLDDEIMN